MNSTISNKEDKMKTIRIVHWAVFDVVDNILENGVPAMDLFNALNPKYKIHGTWALPYGHGVDAMWADYAREKQRHRNSVKPDSFAIQVVADIPISDVQSSKMAALQRCHSTSRWMRSCIPSVMLIMALF